MRVLILGGDGMLGHQLFRHLEPNHHVAVTLRQPLASYAKFRLFNTSNTFDAIDVRSMDRLAEVFAVFKPDAVINCVGIVKQRPSASDSIVSLEVNALLPHRLAVLCRLAGARLVHISTDCVFSGRKGNYQEADKSDAEDLYGRSKFLGEVVDEGSITLRTSIIGFELTRKSSLLEWALAQNGIVKGFRSAVFSGLTTIELSRVIETLLLKYPSAHGLYQVSSNPIDKYTLMQLIKIHLHNGIEVIPDDTLKIDRSLDSTRFRSEFSYQPPSWEAMIETLADLKTEYQN